MGDGIAMEKLGRLYLQGCGVQRDYQKAIQLLEKAVKKGYLKAYEGLSEIYQKGLGVEKDINKAEYYKKIQKQN